MIHQNQLFGEPDASKPDPPKGPRPTSQQAREAIEPHAPRLRERIWEFLELQGEHGACDFEAQHSLGISGDSYRSKRGELVDAGLVFNSGRTRPSASGLPAIVWVTTGEAAKPAPAPRPDPQPKQKSLHLSPDRQRIERRAAEREQSHGPALDGLPAEELGAYCSILPGWPRLFGRTWTPEEARRDPVCRRLLLAAIADDPPASSHQAASCEDDSPPLVPLT